MIRAVICDIDGTLIDSVPAHIEAWKRAFARFGKEVSDEEIRHQIGKGNDDMLPVFSLVRNWTDFGLTWRNTGASFSNANTCLA